MTRIRKSNWIRCLLLAGVACFWLAQARSQTPDAQVDLKAPGFQEFSDRVQKYVELHKSVEATLPKLKSTNEPELIVAHQKALARKIKAARIHAKHGDIFTPAATEAFRKAMHIEFQGPHAEHAQATHETGRTPKKGTFASQSNLSGFNPIHLGATDAVAKPAQTAGERWPIAR